MNTEELRRLAEQATPGPWEFDPGDSTHKARVKQSPGRFGFADSFIPGKYHRYHDAAYIAAANPAAILSLLDELTSEQMERSDAERQLSATRDERDAAEIRADRWHQALLVAEQRVAALEAQLDASMEGLRYMKAQIEEEIAGASDGSLFDTGALAAYNWVLSLFPVLQASAQDTSEGSAIASKGSGK